MCFLVQPAPGFSSLVVNDMCEQDTTKGGSDRMGRTRHKKEMGDLVGLSVGLTQVASVTYLSGSILVRWRARNNR